MIVTLSFDIEEFDFPLERGKEIDIETQFSVSMEGLDKIITLLDRQEIKATFYVTANFAKQYPDVIVELSAKGHEIASHDYYHSLDSKKYPLKSKLELEKIISKKVFGYRSARLASVSLEELESSGYLYDSSINPTYVPTRYNYLRKPRHVYKEGNMVIYPMSVAYPFRIPLFWISLHVMPLWLYRLLCYSAICKDGHLNLYFHPWEFSNRLIEDEFSIPFYIRSCSGDHFLKKIERLIVWLKKSNNRFLTTIDFLHETNKEVII